MNVKDIVVLAVIAIILLMVVLGQIRSTGDVVINEDNANSDLYSESLPPYSLVFGIAAIVLLIVWYYFHSLRKERNLTAK